jgi:signal transduction histidine kinase/DNA-binding NarL/FixJ family response regulator/HPt (histidine-containing phosphotransfer) domain-containing protein
MSENNVKSKKTAAKQPLYVQILFTVSAFALMVVLSYLFMSRIVHSYLIKSTESAFAFAQNQIMADLMEPQIALDGFAVTVRSMIMRGDSAEKLQEYFKEISDYLSLSKQHNIGFNGFLGYFETLPGGPVFMESFVWDRPDTFSPAERHWYLDAVTANGKIVETVMYNDVYYGENILIYSLCIYDEKGNRLGVAGLRVQIDAIGNFIVRTAMANGGYGILLDKDMVILAHPKKEFIGKSAYAPEIPFSIFADEIKNGIEITERELISFKEEAAIAFFKKLPNDWSIGVIMPKGPYYRNVTNMAIILIILGSALSIVLIIVLIRVDYARSKSEIESHHKTSFLANVSHEIRTPMNAIIGMTDLLLFEQLNKRQTGFVNDIKTSAQSLLSIINDILDLSKIESGKLALNPVNYDFHMLLDNLFSMFSYVTQKKGLEFDYETEGKMPNYLFGDDIRLKQVLTNICGNAVKYTEKGYVKFKVTYADDKLTFEIKDSGIGMRKEDLPKLFNNFQRIESDKTRTIVGTGLGLSISKSFVEMMDGKILVDSEYEHGSVFMVIIPAILGKQDEVKSNKGLSEGRTLYAPNAKILVVDDNEFNIKVAEGLLGLFKINVHSAFSGREAINLVQNNEYDMVFMDHMMPEMDGVEATGEIRKLGGKYKQLPIIALTANAVQGVKEMFLSNGFNGFISKPIDMQEMYGILKSWLPPEKIQEREKEDKTKAADGKTSSAFLNAMNKISEINTEIGLSRVSGMENMYRETMELFNKKIVPECDAMAAKINNGDIKYFSVLIHAMKSVLSTIGAMNLSETASRLETASKNDDVEFCTQRFPDFMDKLLILHEELSAIFPNAEAAIKRQSGDTGYLRENIEKALDAVSDFDRDAGLKAINDLLAYDFGAQNNAYLEDAAASFKEFNFSAVTELLSKLEGKIRNEE